MSDLASDLPDAPPQGGDGPAKRAVALLVWAQSILGAQLPVHFILGGLVGQMLAETPALATLPISMIVIASMVAAPILSQLMGRYGRRTGFFIGAGFGALSGLVAVEAILARDFALFCRGDRPLRRLSRGTQPLPLRRGRSRQRRVPGRRRSPT